MKIGCPKEIKPQEFRVGMTPNAAREAGPMTWMRGLTLPSWAIRRQCASTSSPMRSGSMRAAFVPAGFAQAVLRSIRDRGGCPGNQ
ncbi:MAG: hypothetical protein B7Y02_19325 [Rhodobacterales bacterium 17-64-5]|nr:MAG: hypothetical protein B7Y02_19325 [Rhodobacterales bacterium 17-64-5]